MLLRRIFVVLLFAASLHAQEELTVEKIYNNPEFRGDHMSSVRWAPDGERFAYLDYDELSQSTAIFLRDAETGEDKIFLANADLRPSPEIPFRISHFEFSPDGKRLLFSDRLPARDLKKGGTFRVFDLETKTHILEISAEEKQINATFSPDGSKLAFVRANDVYVADVETGEETRLTEDGSDVVLNGLFDWVYEEEFGIINGLAWSPEGTKLAFWRLDQTFVPEIKIQEWDSLYFNVIEMRYPKAGAPSSFVDIVIADVETGETLRADLGEERDVYVPRIKFADENRLTIQRLNRLQNSLDFLVADAATGETTLAFNETAEGGWIEIDDVLEFIGDDRFVWASERDGFRHLYAMNLDGTVERQLTSGEFEVTEDAVAIDAENERVFFLANERGAIYRDLYAVGFDGEDFRRVTREPGIHNIDASPGARYFIDEYSNAVAPTVTTLIDADGNEVAALAKSDDAFIAKYGLTAPEFRTFTTTDGYELWMKTIYPPDYDETKTYPVLFYNYSGPGSQVVLDEWRGRSYLWHSLLAQHGYVVASVDNRGTGGRGTAFKHTVYKNLGYWEANDHAEAARYLVKEGIADPDRIGMWGWSYGGYAAAYTLTTQPDVFSLAVSVAPVTSWRYYDNIYTERYMSTPRLNPEGYESSAVMTHVDNYDGKLLLVHGTADDNVHFQNSVVLVDRLIAANKQFRTMFYPGKNHGIYGGKTREQLFTMMTEFVLDNL
ncbi:MAG: prolyl oligopeptidase family serine peptidase [Ignavibacteriales bacterium]|nr:prolyl oligopeptidase family serine peptidase [Ignavibacteriales bacterium]